MGTGLREPPLGLRDDGDDAWLHGHLHIKISQGPAMQTGNSTWHRDFLRGRIPGKKKCGFPRKKMRFSWEWGYFGVKTCNFLGKNGDFPGNGDILVS